MVGFAPLTSRGSQQYRALSVPELTQQVGAGAGAGLQWGWGGAWGRQAGRVMLGAQLLLNPQEWMALAPGREAPGRAFSASTQVHRG